MTVDLMEVMALDRWFVDLIELQGERALFLQPGVDQTTLRCATLQSKEDLWSITLEHEWDAGALVQMNVPSISILNESRAFVAAGPHRVLLELETGQIVKHLKADRWPSGEAHASEDATLVPEGDRLSQYFNSDLRPSTKAVPNGHWILGRHPLRFPWIVVEDPDGMQEPWLWRPQDDLMLDLPSLVAASADQNDEWIPIHSPVLVRDDLVIHPESCCERVALRALSLPRLEVRWATSFPQREEDSYGPPLSLLVTQPCSSGVLLGVGPRLEMRDTRTAKLSWHKELPFSPQQVVLSQKVGWAVSNRLIYAFDLANGHHLGKAKVESEIVRAFATSTGLGISLSNGYYKAKIS